METLSKRFFLKTFKFLDFISAKEFVFPDIIIEDNNLIKHYFFKKKK